MPMTYGTAMIAVYPGDYLGYDRSFNTYCKRFDFTHLDEDIFLMKYDIGDWV
jgi:hypothetical protein